MSMTKPTIVASFMFLAACTVQTDPQPAQPMPPPGEGEMAEEGPMEGEEGPPVAEASAEAAAGGEMGAFECHGNEARVIDGTTVNGNVNAHGNCSLQIRGSRINGKLDVHGNSAVVIDGSEVSGGVDLHGNATLTARGTVFHGKIDKHGNASLVDGGGNTWR
jgi:hypothetical protein